jgi:hypothetical protein
LIAADGVCVGSLLRKIVFPHSPSLFTHFQAHAIGAAAQAGQLRMVVSFVFRDLN